MVNEAYVQALRYFIDQDLHDQLKDQPVIMPGGVAVDHYRGVGNTLKAQAIPFYRDSYEATEFLYGWIPLKDPLVPALYFQFPVLNVKGKNVPAACSFASVVDAPVPETIVTPSVNLTNRYLPFAAMEADGLKPKAAFKGKARWTPLLEALNTDKEAGKACIPKRWTAQVGKYEVKVDILGPIGLTQMAPYRGFTIITGQRVPGPKANVDYPAYAFAEELTKRRTMSQFIRQHPQVGEEVGVQVVMKSNEAMMSLVHQHIDGLAGAGAPPAAPPTPRLAPAAAGPAGSPAAQPAPAGVPCPTCGGTIQVGWRFCPHCKQELVWE